jgi:hypothetical protein
MRLFGRRLQLPGHTCGCAKLKTLPTHLHGVAANLNYVGLASLRHVLINFVTSQTPARVHNIYGAAACGTPRRQPNTSYYFSV